MQRCQKYPAYFSYHSPSIRKWLCCPKWSSTCHRWCNSNTQLFCLNIDDQRSRCTFFLHFRHGHQDGVTHDRHHNTCFQPIGHLPHRSTYLDTDTSLQMEMSFTVISRSKVDTSLCLRWLLRVCAATRTSRRRLLAKNDNIRKPHGHHLNTWWPPNVCMSDAHASSNT